MHRLIVVIVVVLCTAVAQAATCPFNIPVVTLAPHQANGFSWGTVIRPMTDACISHIVIDPTNNNAWYAGGFNALYMTKNNGQTWTKPVSGNVDALLIVPGQPNLVYAGIGNKLYLSRDSGAVWTVINTFAKPIRSLLVAGGTLFIGIGWNTHAVPSGIWVSNLGGGFMKFQPFGAGQTGLIVWTLSRDPQSGAIYAGTEIFNHPQPYKPPFFRSSNGGVLWTKVANLPWHAVDSAVRPNDGYVYALTEGEGVYGSANMGASWQPPSLSPGLGVSLLMDPKTPTRLFVGRHKFGTLNGGIFVSTNAGKTYAASGLTGVTVADIALNGTGTRIYAAAYGSGIYRSPVP